MPQFDPANWFPQFVWLAIVFAILYFGIVRTTLPRIGRVVAARDDKVSSDVDGAARAKAEADRMAADYDSGLAAARDSARAKLEAARGEAARSLEAKLAETRTALDAQAQEAAASLDGARVRAMAQIEDVAAEAAAQVVEKLTGSRPDTDAAGAAARAALA